MFKRSIRYALFWCNLKENAVINFHIYIYVYLFDQSLFNIFVNNINQEQIEPKRFLT